MKISDDVQKMLVVIGVVALIVITLMRVANDSPDLF